jgi:acyl-[acyl-carrier-protein]-phospholipid O-acyltransferase / long-chain-fatty-acid--[acyl-carrier-protein] ligase
MLLHREFVTVAKTRGDKLAFLDRSTGRRVSYGRALIGSLLLARRFRRYDDGYIGIMVPNSAGCALSVLATLMAGRVPVMINYSTGAEHNARFAQRKCDFKTIITSRTLLEKVGCNLVDGMVCIEEIMQQVTVLEKSRALLQSKLPTRSILKQVHHGSAGDTAVILFTSGSEREPKVVELSHRNIGSNVNAAREVFAFHDTDVLLAILPLFHVFGQTTNLWLPLSLGLTIVTYANPLEFRTISRIIRDDKPTILIATPYFLMGYLRQSAAGDFKSLRVVVVGADKTPEWLRRGYLEQHGVSVYEGYGTTETSPVISVNLPGASKPGSVGKPLPGVSVKIADIKSGKTLGSGQEGKVLVKGDLVMKGYLGDIEETALRIEDGWYETGDMGVLDEDGFLWHRGRLKRFVKIGGEMVSLVMVEDALQEMMPDDAELCVVEIPDAKKGASIAVALDHEVDRKAVLDKLSQRLPPLALPRYFLVLDELPKMGSGKVDFRKTAELVMNRLKST